MSNAFVFKVYYNPNISPATNSTWAVVSVTANEQPQQAQETIISLICVQHLSETSRKDISGWRFGRWRIISNWNLIFLRLSFSSAPLRLKPLVDSKQAVPPCESMWARSTEVPRCGY